MEKKTRKLKSIKNFPTAVGISSNFGHRSHSHKSKIFGYSRRPWAFGPTLKINIMYLILLYFFTAYAAEQLMLILKSPTRNTTMLSNNGKQSNCLSSFKTFVRTNWERLFSYSTMAAFWNFCPKSICDKSPFYLGTNE